MKHVKKVFGLLMAATILAAPTSVFAAAQTADVTTNIRGTCGFGINTSELTDEQKASLEEYCKQVTDARKESINNMIKDGVLTQEQGSLALERIDAMTEYHEEYGYGVGMMNGTGYCQDTTGNVGHGRGMMGGRH